jgi:hypothetical protein
MVSIFHLESGFEMQIALLHCYRLILCFYEPLAKLKETVSRDFRQPVFFIKQLPLGP